MRKIIAKDVAEVMQMNDRQLVFKFRFTGNPPTFMIVKAEWRGSSVSQAHAAPSVAWASKLMQRATPGMDVELLANDELSALKWISPRAFKPFQARDRLLGSCDGNVVYKMPFFETLRDANSLNQKGKARKLLSKLKGNSEMLQMLGKIVAVDLFNGNLDRFNLKGAVENPTNIFFVKNGDKSYTPVGVDFVHLQREAADLIGPPPVADRGPQNIDIQWGGPILMNDQTRAVYAAQCIAGLNNMFRTALLGDGPVHPQELLLYSDQVEFATGLRKGVKKLQKYLAQEAVHGRLPAGILTRMELLNWTWSMPGPARPQAATPDRMGFVSRGIYFENRS